MAAKERTRNAITDAFNELIRTVPFKKISVDMIAEKADIGRATFYRYFRDKYDVMNDNYTRLLNSCSELEHVTGFHKLYIELFKAARASFWVSIRASFKSDGYNSFKNFIAKESYAYAERVVKKTRSGNGLTEAENLQLNVFVYGISHVYEDWTFKKINMTPEEAADALFAVMPESIRDYPL